MTTDAPVAPEEGDRYVSTGHLPPAHLIRAYVDQAHRRFRDNGEGANYAGYPALARVDPDLFGICVADVEGNLFPAGDADHSFASMSVIKPFVFALVAHSAGVMQVRRKVGLNATGMEFNSVVAIELQRDHMTNPMVNAGAMAVASLAPGNTGIDKWGFILAGLRRFAGRELEINDEVYESVSQTNWRNQAIARLLYGHDRLYFDPVAVTDIYTRQSSIAITAVDLAIMAATLANGGVNPRTRERVVGPRVCQYTLAVMTTAGMYETSGDWLFDIGLPGKSGIGGGVITAAPGKGGMATFAPPLDRAGNSVKGQLVAKYLSQGLGMNLFASGQ